MDHGRDLAAVDCSLCCASSGSILATGCGNDVKTWDTYTGACLCVFKGHLDTVDCCAFAHHEWLLATGSDDGSGKIWNSRTGTCLFTLPLSRYLNHCCAFSPDDACLATGANTTLMVWNTRTGTHICSLLGHDYSVSSCAYSLDGVLLASASFDDIARIWKTADASCLFMIQGHKLHKCAFSPRDITMLITSSYNGGPITLWNPHTGTGTDICQPTMIEHESSNVCSCAFSADGGYLVTASNEGTVRVRMWDMCTESCVYTCRTHQDNIAYIAILSDGLMMYTVSMDGVGRVWRLPHIQQCVNTLLLILVGNRSHHRLRLPVELWQWINDQDIDPW